MRTGGNGTRIRTARLLLRPAALAADPAQAEPCRRWAVVLPASGEVVGGVTLSPLPPDDVDLRVAWHITPEARGNGFASEAGHAVAHHAFDAGLDEVFAVVPPHDATGAAAARRIGMEWVGVTEKYYNRRLQVYRLRRGDLDVPALTVLKRRQELLPSLGWAGPMGLPVPCPGLGTWLEHPAFVGTGG